MNISPCAPSQRLGAMGQIAQLSLGFAGTSRRRSGVAFPVPSPKPHGPALRVGLVERPSRPHLDVEFDCARQPSDAVLMTCSSTSLLWRQRLARWRSGPVVTRQQAVRRRRAVQVGHAPPVDRAVGPDQRHAAAVAKRGILVGRQPSPAAGARHGKWLPPVTP